DTFDVTGAQTAHLMGGAGADLFQFGAGAVLTGTLDGGADTDTVDFAAQTAARQVTLTGLGSVDGFAGTETTAIRDGFTNIDRLRGGAASDTLAGLDAAAAWTLNGTNTYASTRTLTFSSFEHLVGGRAADTFTVLAS